MKSMLLWVLCVGCLSPPSSPTIGEGEGDSDVGDPQAGVLLLQRVAGLWTGPATSTTALGDFPVMSMDMQDVAGTMVFGRGDFDDSNAIRFGLAIEDVEDRPTLVFRSGGLFAGFSRDSRAGLLEHDDELGMYRFCDVPRGCGYVDSTWSIQGDELLLTAVVQSRPHMRWEARREEARAVPIVDDRNEHAGDFPSMATLTSTIAFPAVAADADVWLLLTTTPCGLSFACTPSRSKRVSVVAGASRAVVVLEQLHAGDYAANAILDRDRNLADALVPTPGDGAARLDAQIIVGSTDVSETMPIVFTVP
jgi:hypothetical protein